MTLPRVLVVSRSSIRKNKFVDFVGEYHLDLLVANGAIPVIVPRVAGILNNLDSFDPIHGVLLCEGEDIDPSLHSTTTTPTSSLSQSDLDEIRHLHQSDTNIDHNKDSIELALTNLCFRRNIPILGICRGSQLLNVACGGTLFLDLQKQLSHGNVPVVVHVDYGNYDGHRHEVRVVEGTPLESWFMESLVDGEIMVNSYHHQGVKKLAERFAPMAFAMDGLVEGFYDPHCYNPEEGKFVVGLQFHPERLRRSDSEEFDYPGCKSVYQEFVKAVVAYQKKLNSAGSVPKSVMLDQEIEKKRKINMIIRSFFVTRNMYVVDRLGTPASKAIGFEAGADFLKSNVEFCLQQEKRLKQMGATIRDGSSFLWGLWLNEEREMLARNVMGKMSIEQLSELVSSFLISHDGAD